jgi:alkylation response protein AidB-like acyl-CoA dehydrogenase
MLSPALEMDGVDSARNPLVEAARQLGPLIKRNIEHGERERRLPRATADALTDAGFFRVCRPRPLGGLEADPITVFDVVEEIARHDGSAAWCALNCGIAGVLQSLLPAEGADAIGADPGLVYNGVIAPSGRAGRVDGGYRVTGRWAFASNCHHCNWLVLTSIVHDGDTMVVGPSGPELVMSWIKTSDCRIVDTWHTAGLRATGSHDVEVSDVFVSRSLTIPLPLPEPVADGALFRFPIVGLWSVGLAASSLGIARAAVDELVRLATAKTPFGMASTLATRATAQIAICEAIGAVRSARAFVLDEAERVWTMVQAGVTPTAEARALLRVATSHAAATSARAVDRMYETAGGSAIFTSSPLQRCFRDVHTITQHLFVAPATYEMLGKILLGVETDGFML